MLVWKTRGRFIIDPEGIVQGYEVLTPPVGRKVLESLRQIQAFSTDQKQQGCGSNTFFSAATLALILSASPCRGPLP